MSPFPMIGIWILGLSFTSLMSDQSAFPVYIWALVRPWMVRASIPQSCNCSARVVITKFSLSQPKRVFTVTGVLTALTTSLVMSNNRGILRNIPEPAPLLATFLTGQPKFKSITSGDTCSTILAASTIDSTSRPYIWMPTGRSLSAIESLLIVDLMLRTNASALTNSVYTIAAPKRLQSIRKPISVTSSIGARNKGFSPRSIFLIFIVQLFVCKSLRPLVWYIMSYP